MNELHILHVHCILYILHCTCTWFNFPVSTPGLFFKEDINVSCTTVHVDMYSLTRMKVGALLVAAPLLPSPPPPVCTYPTNDPDFKQRLFNIRGPHLWNTKKKLR